MNPFIEGERKKAEGQNRTEAAKGLKLLLQFVQHCDCIIEKRFDDQTLLEDDKLVADVSVQHNSFLGTWRNICVSLADGSGTLTIVAGLEEKEFIIGGAKLQLAFDNRTEVGQELMRELHELHELVIILFHHARLQFDA